MESRQQRIAKKRRKVTFRFLVVLFFGLMIVLAVLLTVFLIRRGVSSSQPLTQLRFSEGDNYIFTGSGYLFIKDSTLSYDDLGNDKNDVSSPIQATNPSLAGSSTIQLVYTSAGMQIVNVSEPVQFTDKLLDVECGQSSIVALFEDAAGENYLQVFDKQGVSRDLLEYDGQYVLNFGFYSSAQEFLYVIAMTTQSGTPLSTITVYDLSAMTMSGVSQVQSQLIEHMYFSPSSMFAVGTNQIIRYSLSNSRESYRETVYGWSCLDYADSPTPAFLFKPRSTDALGTIKLLQLKDGDIPEITQRLIQLPPGTINAFLANGRIIAVTDNSIIQVGFDGKYGTEKKLSITVHSVSKLNQTTAQLFDGENYYYTKIS